MRERDIQDYLFMNPEVLFPGKNIQEKAREYLIHGKRIDLLFVVDGVRYIVEIKAIPIARDHIGQIVEYYGLMKEYLKEANLRMILVSPSIPKWRSVFLEELGIQCFEIKKIPENKIDAKTIIENAIKKRKQHDQMIEYEQILNPDDKFKPNDFDEGCSQRKLALVNRIVKKSLEVLRNHYTEYEIVPYKISRAHSLDFDYEYHAKSKYGKNEFTQGGIWWAFRFGFQSEMPPNDVPNISLIFNKFGLDITVNAELQPSQKFLIKKIISEKQHFNRLLKLHGDLWFKSYLKYEHQPRYYNWILTDFAAPGTFNTDTIIKSYDSHQNNFQVERDCWLPFIIENNPQLTDGRINQLKKANKNLNLAIRLTRRIEKHDEIWYQHFTDQLQFINLEVIKLKPFVDFFIKKY